MDIKLKTTGQNVNMTSRSNPRVMMIRLARLLVKMKDIKFLILIVAVIAVIGLISYGSKIGLDESEAMLLFRPVNTLSGPIAWIIFAILLFIGLYVMAVPFGAGKHERAMRSVGMVNKLGEVPELVSSMDRDGFKEYEYFSQGIPIREYMDKRDRIESALNVHILDIIYRGNMQTVVIKARPGTEMLPDYIAWSDEYLLDKHGKALLTLGMGIGNMPKRVDLDALPHILIGGATGSGKTVEMKCMLYQCVQYGWVVYLFDFKGGVDYNVSERENYNIVSDLYSAKMMLSGLYENLKKRIERFAETECKNIEVYNSRYPDQPMPRIIIAIDEAASLFLTKGLEKEDKDAVVAITRTVEEIARKGRAVGLNLIISTQRPDADAVPGQIKSNLDTRIAGRSNEVLSRVIIDSTKATEIPEDAPGRFVDNNDKFFQGFDF